MYDPQQAKLIEEFADGQRRLYAYLLILVPVREEAATLLHDTNLAMMTAMESLETVSEFGRWSLNVAREQAVGWHRERLETGAWCYGADLLNDVADVAEKLVMLRSSKTIFDKALQELADSDRALLRRAYKQDEEEVSAASLRRVRSALFVSMRANEGAGAEDWLQLVDDVVDGNAPDEDRCRLNARLSDSEMARTVFARYLEMHARLIWEYSESVDLDSRYQRPPRPRKPIRWKLTAAVTLALSLGVAAWVVDHRGGTAELGIATQTGALAVDRSSPEATLRTFWRAIERDDLVAARACVDADRLRQGRHGRDVSEFLRSCCDLDSSSFEFVPVENGCSIRSPVHNLTYDMESRDEQNWVIVSIHP